MPNRGVSFITVTYNSEQFIQDCIESIFKSPIQEIEIIIIDNYSSDSTIKVVERQMLGESRIKLIKNDRNLGLCKALNQGISLATYDVITTINPDVIIKKEYVNVILNEFFKNENIGICYCWISYLNQDKIYSKGVVLRSDFKFFNLGRNVLDETPIIAGNGACIAYAKKDLVQVGGFDENFFMFNEEVDISIRIQNLGKKIKIVEEVLIEHFHCHSYDNRDIKFAFLYNLNALRIAIKSYPLNILRKGIGLFLISFIIDILLRPHIIAFKSIPFILKHSFNLIIMIIPYFFKREKTIAKFDIYTSQTSIKKLLNYRYGKANS